MTEKIKFKAANPPKIMKYDHFAHSAMEAKTVKTQSEESVTEIAIRST